MKFEIRLVCPFFLIANAISFPLFVSHKLLCEPPVPTNLEQPVVKSESDDPTRGINDADDSGLGGAADAVLDVAVGSRDDFERALRALFRRTHALQDHRVVARRE